MLIEAGMGGLFRVVWVGKQWGRGLNAGLGLLGFKEVL